MSAFLLTAAGGAGSLLLAQDPENNQDSYVKDGSTAINVKNADLSAIVRVFSSKTKRNYILDERVKGKVTIYLPGTVSSANCTGVLTIGIIVNDAKSATGAISCAVTVAVAVSVPWSDVTVKATV